MWHGFQYDFWLLKKNAPEASTGRHVHRTSKQQSNQTSHKKYSSFLEAGRRQGLALYNLNSEEGECITASIAQGFERKEVKAETLSLDRKTLELDMGESYTLQEAMEPYNTTESQVTWESSDDRIVSVDEDGTVTALGKGQVQITAKGQSGNLSAVCQVTVPRTPILPSASVSPTVLPTRMPDAAGCPDSTGTPSPSAAVRPAVTASIPPKTTGLLDQSTESTGGHTNASQGTGF